MERAESSVPSVVSPTDLVGEGGSISEGVKFVCISPTDDPPAARDAFAKKHLPGAVYWQIEATSDASVPYPHALTPRDQVHRGVHVYVLLAVAWCGGVS